MSKVVLMINEPSLRVLYNIRMDSAVTTAGGLPYATAIAALAQVSGVVRLFGFHGNDASGIGAVR